MKSYAGKSLRINLSRRKIKIEKLPKVLCRMYMGGKGFGAKILLEEMTPGIDPYDSSNLLIFATGPVNGTTLSGGAKFCAVFKSPLTGIWGESQCGGYFAPVLKYAGFDLIVVSGRAEKPVYVTIYDDDVQVRDASHLWGSDTFEVERTVKGDHGKRFQVLSIGPAGENLVRYACINHAGGRQFGRCGGGGVMGSKRLKALAVNGSGSVKIAKPSEFDDFKKELNEKIRKRLKSLMKYGTSPMISLTNTTGTLPTRYWKEGRFAGCERINATQIKKIIKHSKACFACSIACGKITEVKDGPYAGTVVEGPEYETLFAFGSLCENHSLGAIAKANEICDRLGMDTISAGNIIAFAMDSYEAGFITKESAQGENLTFGNEDAIISVLRKIAYREGIGDVLAEGVRMASKIIGKGAEKLAIHVNGLEPPGYDPRGIKGAALAYAVSCRGACHLRHMAYRPNLKGKHPFGEGQVDRLSYNGQANIVKESEDFYTLVDSMVLCRFVCLPTIGPILWEELARLYSILTGISARKKELVALATRINNSIRCFNVREGIDKAEETLPRRFTEEPVEGEVVENRKFYAMIEEYNQIREEHPV